MTLSPGTSVGPYQVLALIGAGGMGEVYRARDARLRREVALKVLHESVAADPDRLRRFEQEARAAGALTHPNILTVYDVGTCDGTPYVVSELLEGETLGSKLAGSPLPLRKSLDYAIQAANGLAAAHAKGIVHRDLKPENLFVTNDGRVKILDFGLAKLSEPTSQPAVSEAATVSTPPHTAPGTVLGTVGYMSPEQLRGLAADQRSDIFSFGAVLYEMLCGRRAFKGDTATETMYAILKHDPLELTGTDRLLSPGIVRILRHCLEKSPEERFQSARDLAFHLEAISGSSEATGPPVERVQAPSRRRWAWAANCLVVTDSPGEGQPAALFVVSLETGEKRRLTNPRPPASGDANPAVSPDGSWLVFRRSASGLFSGELYRLPLGRGLTAVGEPRRLTPAALDANYPTWMPDSREILFSAKGSLWRLVVPGESTPARLPFAGEDGLMPVVSRSPPGRPPRLVYVRSFEDWNIWRIETSAPGATASSPPVVSVSSTRADDMPQLSPDGRRVALTSDRSGGWEIWLADPDGSNAVQLTSMGASASGYPHWSLDGRLIAFHSNLEGQWEVYVIPAAGGKPRNLTSHLARDSFPSFSRDGKWIYFTSNRTGEDRIWKVPASGGDAVAVTDNVGLTPLESPDGAYVYYVQTVFTPSPLWRLPVSGGVPVKVLEGVVLGNFVVLERGIYYIDRPSGEGGIYRIDRPSGETRLQYFDLATRRSTTVARNLGHVDVPLTASADGRHHSLSPDGLVRRRPDAGGELPLTLASGASLGPYQGGYLPVGSRRRSSVRRATS